MPTIAANGLEVGYDVVGAGPPIVALHGATSLGREDYAAQLPGMSKGFLIHLPDARGHGRTRWDAANGFEYRWLVDDLIGFVDGLGLDSFHLIGFSMGAMTALHFGALFPERLRTLVVVGITTQREPRASVGQHLMDAARIVEKDPAFAAILARRHDVGQGIGAWQRLLPAIAADIRAQPLLTPAELHAIDCPSMVVCGDRDPFVPPEHAAALVRQLPAGRLFVAPDCGHEVMSRRPGLFNEAISGFYRSTEEVARQRAARLETGAEARQPPKLARRTRMTTLLVLYRAPEGGEAALATFEARYRDEHLPLVAETPGLRATRVWRVKEALGADTDLVLAAALDFDDRESMDAALRSDPMRAAGRILREIAPGLATFLVVEDAPDLLGGKVGG